MKKKTTNTLAQQREVWLNRATALFTSHWATLGVKVPADVQLSCGFPGGGSIRRRIGECWPRSRSAIKVNQVFVSPVLAEPLVALDVLGHELLHAADDCLSMHGRVFTRNSAMVGYSGGKHSAAVSVTALALKDSMLKRLGAYPHGQVLLNVKKAKTSDGLHKFTCEEHGDTLYSTAKMVDEHGVPKCRKCGEDMLLHDRAKKKVITTV